MNLLRSRNDNMSWEWRMWRDRLKLNFECMIYSISWGLREISVSRGRFWNGSGMTHSWGSGTRPMADFGEEISSLSRCDYIGFTLSLPYILNVILDLYI